MASVFLSYARDDAAKARSIAIALEKAGHSVWWDRHIRGGTEYSKEIEQALSSAEAVVVLWSAKSVESPWVRDEASAGRDRGRLIPVLLEQLSPPMGFRQYQILDFSGWRGRGKPSHLAELLESIEAVSGSRSEAPSATLAKLSPRSRLPGSFPTRSLIVGAVVMLILIALSIVLGDKRKPSIPVIAVAAADTSPGSQALARDMFVKLGTLQTARPDTIDLVSHRDTDRKAAVTFQVGRTGQRAEANLALIDASNSSLLWAKNLRDPNGNEADLRQQLAYTAAHVLRCALEGMEAAGGQLSRQALKTYLNACSSDPSTGDPSASITALRQLVRQAPRFAGAWGKLLLAETAVAIGPLRPEARAMRQVLTQDISEARKIHPELAEAYFAEYELTPDPQFLERSRLLDRGIERNPDNPALRVARSIFLMSVGRMDESLADSRRAVELDPLSPDARYDYISALAFSGRMDEALSELGQAERVWPGATSILDARLRLHLRLGDPREALRLLRSGAMKNASTPWVRLHESLLQARIDRSSRNVEKAIRDATTAFDREPGSIRGLSQTLVEFNREEELFQILLNWQRIDIVTRVVDVLFRPGFSDFHKDPRFMRVAKRLGLVAYWRATGKWPDFCSRADLSYDCKSEAAKLG